MHGKSIPINKKIAAWISFELAEGVMALVSFDDICYKVH